MKLLVANRGEIAIRIMRAAAELDIPTVSVYPKDDAEALHTGKADEAVELQGSGAAAYLDIEQIVAIAKDFGCDAVHPGYGFLAENSGFAGRCGEEGLTFIGPRVDTLELFGDKARARVAAVEAGVPVIRGIDHAVSLAEAVAFFGGLAKGRGMMVKALAGGGGRGTRVVTLADELEETYERCRSEAKAAFGNGDVYVEEFIQRARHVEVQILGDLHGDIIHLGERECSVQRYFQKVVEVAPAPGLADDLRGQIIDAAMNCARSVNYTSLGTFEFLVDVSENGSGEAFAFIEANARLQVEHTVTEAVTGVDIVQAQIRMAEGASIADLGLDDPRIGEPRGYAIQARVCMETIREDGSVSPTAGTLTVYEAPSGPGVRTDGFGYSGYPTSMAFDSLLGKVIGHSPSKDFRDAIAKTSRALSEFRIEGVATNIAFLQNILAHENFASGKIHTRFVDEQIAQLAATGDKHRRFVDPVGTGAGASPSGFAGARVDNSQDPLALFNHDKQVKSQDPVVEEISDSARDFMGPPGSAGFVSPIQGTIVSIDVAVGDAVRTGQTVAMVEAMKLQHPIKADRSGIVCDIIQSVGDIVREGFPIVFVNESYIGGGIIAPDEAVDPDYIRPDLQEFYDRRKYIFDDFRPHKIAKRRKTGHRSARENIAHLLDDGSFKEYGSLSIAPSWQSNQWLRENTPTDGLIMGIGTVNRHLFGEERSRVIAVHYDYMVVAGTQGGRGHYKQDRMYTLARRFKLPLVLFPEGGGGRPGISGGERAVPAESGKSGAADLQNNLMARTSAGVTGYVGMDTDTFTEFSRLSGLVPLVGVNSGRCFAGNTSLLACCDIIISTENSTIAMGGPAMIEGGGLGIYTPEEVGPMAFQVPNGVVDILVKDCAAAVETAQKYISYFQGSIDHWEEPDQRKLRAIVPEDRSLIYDMRELIKMLVDKDSILEIREKFGVGIITALVRLEGRPMGLIANNPHHLAGAIDSDSADKGARFLQLCDTFDLPVISLIDCPGVMVGREYESAALVRHCGRLFNTGANLRVPVFGVVVRKGYGLGVHAMCGGWSWKPFFTVAWPTAEFAGMNIDAQVSLRYHEELSALEDPDERKARYDSWVAALYENARAVNSAGERFGIDEVIDPADTREWIAQGARSQPPLVPREGKKKPFIDTW